MNYVLPFRTAEILVSGFRRKFSPHFGLFRTHRPLQCLTHLRSAPPDMVHLISYWVYSLRFAIFLAQALVSVAVLRMYCTYFYAAKYVLYSHEHKYSPP